METARRCTSHVDLVRRGMTQRIFFARRRTCCTGASGKSQALGQQTAITIRPRGLAHFVENPGGIYDAPHQLLRQRLGLQRDLLLRRLLSWLLLDGYSRPGSSTRDGHECGSGRSSSCVDEQDLKDYHWSLGDDGCHEEAIFVDEDCQTPRPNPAERRAPATEAAAHDELASNRDRLQELRETVSAVSPAKTSPQSRPDHNPPSQRARAPTFRAVAARRIDGLVKMLLLRQRRRRRGRLSRLQRACHQQRRDDSTRRRRHRALTTSRRADSGRAPLPRDEARSLCPRRRERRR